MSFFTLKLTWRVCYFSLRVLIGGIVEVSIFVVGLELFCGKVDSLSIVKLLNIWDLTGYFVHFPRRSGIMAMLISDCHMDFEPNNISVVYLVMVVLSIYNI